MVVGVSFRVGPSRGEDNIFFPSGFSGWNGVSFCLDVEQRGKTNS